MGLLLNRLSSVWAPSALCLAALAAVLAAARDDRQPTGRGPDVETLVRRLGDEDFAVRQEAARLLAQREDAIPALRRALDAADPELARGAAAVLAGLDLGVRRLLVGRLKRLAEAGEIDRLAEVFGRHPPGEDEEEAWKVVLRAPDGQTAQDQARMQGDWADIETEVYEVTLADGGAPGLKKVKRDRRREEESPVYSFSGDKVTITSPGSFGELGSTGEFRLAATGNARTVRMTLGAIGPRRDRPQEKWTTTALYSFGMHTLVLAYQRPDGTVEVHTLKRCKS
jgi:hypothetical protein